MPYQVSDIATALVRTLAYECLDDGGDQIQWVMLGPDGRKIVVLLTMTDAASERLLEFCDEQIDSGEMMPRREE